MNRLADLYPGYGVTSAALEVLGGITIVVALAWAADRLLARPPRRLAQRLWLSALVVVLATPALTLLGRQLPWRVAAFPVDGPSSAPTKLASSDAEPVAPSVRPDTESPGEWVEQTQATPLSGLHVAAPSASRPVPSPPRAEVRTPPVPEVAVAAAVEPAAPPGNYLHAFVSLGFIVWWVGGAYLGFRLLHGWWRLRGLRRRLHPLNDDAWAEDLAEVARLLGVRRLPRVCLSPDARSPLVLGLFRPCVVLPERLLDRGGPHLRDVLVHEWAHVVRRDPWVLLLQRLAVILFWIHPLVHLLNRRLDRAREEVCDNHVLAHVDAPAYAETLLSVAQLCYPLPQFSGYLTMMPSRYSLERRVADLLEERRDRSTRLSAVARAAVVTALALTLTAVSSVGLESAAGAHEGKDKAASPPPSKEPVSPAVAAKPSAAADVGKVTGRVVNAADGRPVADAEVRLSRRTPALSRRAKTNGRGEFSFDGVPAGEFRILCFHGDLASRAQMYRGDVVSVAADGAAKPVVLKMRPTPSIRVKVLSQSDSKPIPGARVRLIWTDTDRDHAADAKGEVELKGLTPETWHVEATAQGYASAVRIVNLANGEPATLEMKLSPGGSLQGRIKDEHGKPLAGVGLNVYPDSSGSPSDYVESDADGNYRFDFLPLDQSVRLLARKLEHLQFSKDFRIPAGGGRVARLDLVLKTRPHGGSVRGTVTDKQGKPVAGAEIVNRGGSSDEVRRVTTDARGKFLLDNVYPDSHGQQFIVRAKGFAPQRVEFKPGPADRPAEADVTLEPGHRVKGRVINEAGKPIPGVRVYFAHGNHPPGADLGGSGMTDAQGRFELDSLPERAPFTFHVEGYSEIPELELPLDGKNAVVVRMTSQGVIKGRVVDAATGKPVPRYLVRITFSPDRRPDEPATGILAALVESGEDFASPQGRFVLKDLMAGMPLQVTVTADGYRREVVRRAVAGTAADAEAIEVRMTTEDPAKLVTVRGKLIDHKGKPVRGAELRLIVASERPAQRDAFPYNWDMIESGQVELAAEVLQVRRLTTAADGAFEFLRVPGEADLELVLWGKGIPGFRVDGLERLTEKQRTNLTVQAAAPARVTGVIDRKAFPEFDSILLSGSSRFFRAKLDAGGKQFTVEDLPAGKYEIQVYGPVSRVEGKPGALQQQVIGRKSVTLEEGKEEKVSLGEEDKTGS